jgi:hypothetical protein
VVAAGAGDATPLGLGIILVDVHHLYEFIWKHHLPSFNAELAKNTDKRIKITTVSKVEDFGEIP